MKLHCYRDGLLLSIRKDTLPCKRPGPPSNRPQRLAEYETGRFVSQRDLLGVGRNTLTVMLPLSASHLNLPPFAENAFTSARACPNAREICQDGKKRTSIYV